MYVQPKGNINPPKKTNVGKLSHVSSVKLYPFRGYLCVLYAKLELLLAQFNATELQASVAKSEDTARTTLNTLNSTSHYSARILNILPSSPLPRPPHRALLLLLTTPDNCQKMFVRHASIPAHSHIRTHAHHALTQSHTLAHTRFR